MEKPLGFRIAWSGKSSGVKMGLERVSSLTQMRGDKL